MMKCSELKQVEILSHGKLSSAKETFKDIANIKLNSFIQPICDLVHIELTIQTFVCSFTMNCHHECV